MWYKTGHDLRMSIGRGYMELLFGGIYIVFKSRQDGNEFRISLVLGPPKSTSGAPVVVQAELRGAYSSRSCIGIISCSHTDLRAAYNPGRKRVENVDVMKEEMDVEGAGLGGSEETRNKCYDAPEAPAFYPTAKEFVHPGR
eukprot:337878-Rhodomonas_salina.4